MFNFRLKKNTETLLELHNELQKSKQEREAARMGLASAVYRLMQEVRSFPLDEKVEMVATDLAATKGEQR